VNGTGYRRVSDAREEGEECEDVDGAEMGPESNVSNLL